MAIAIKEGCIYEINLDCSHYLFCIPLFSHMNALCISCEWFVECGMDIQAISFYWHWSSQLFMLRFFFAQMCTDWRIDFEMRAILKTGGFSNIFMPPIFSCWILLSLIAMDNCYLFFFAHPLKIYLVQYRKELIFKNELWTHCIKLHKSRSFSLF